MAKASVDATAWKTKTVDEFTVPGTSAVWRTQTVVAPDGTKLVGLRKFARKSNGTIVNTNAGFSVAHDEVAPRLLRKLSKMLTELADSLE